jgi:hypothetical protein
MIIQKTREEIELMRESAMVVSKTLGMIASEIKPGVTTLIPRQARGNFYSRPWRRARVSWTLRIPEFALYEPERPGCTRHPEQ